MQCIAFALVFWIAQMLTPKLPQPFGLAVLCLLALICVLFLLDWAGVVNVVGGHRHWR